ncbi:GyrI-like domain-containing protein [Asticcacaulis solisilvae]|uniref:GyrI-like domain-containing protein n=1 Tax=Asticcacaulis solisilvae TaxID=1217274 RepID=UPI003FD88A91
MSKIDLKTEYKSLYSASAREFSLIEVPALKYLMFDGKGDPNTAPEYQQAIEALYSLSYTLKFTSKRAFDRDYVVGPLEGLWYADDLSTFVSRQKSKWSWTMMILQPDWICEEMVKGARSEVLMKKGLPGIEKARLETLEEGLCAQILHVGSYDDEGPVLKRLHEEWLPANGLIETGHHHEIYLSDPRKTVPEKLRTLLRQPVKRA